MTKAQRNILVVAILAAFVPFLDGSVVNVALPAMARELGGGLALQQWVVDAYLLALGSLILVAGSLSDMFGRVRILVAGLWLFGLASVVCALAPDGTWLVLARVVQGAGGALVVPSSLALIIDNFRGAEQGRAIGSWTAWTGMSFIVGPLVGGILVDGASWRLIFAINVLPIALTLLLARQLPRGQRRPARIDVPGAVLCAAGLGTLVYALIEQGRLGWQSPLVWGGSLLGVGLLAAFVAYERWTVAPMLPLELFCRRNFWVGNLATVAVYAGLSVAGFLVVIFLQQVGKFSALWAGAAMMPVTLIMFGLSKRIGQWSGRVGPRWFMAAGPMLAAAGFVMMTAVGQPVNYWASIFPGIVTFGLGLALTVSPLTSAVLGAVVPERAGIASAVNNAVARIAGLLAVAAVGLLTGPQLANVAGFRLGLWVTAALLAAGGLISAVGIENPKE